jgi:2-keto-4-pentenoate hydratase
MTIDGKEVSSGTGSAVLGDPLNALVWLANDRARRGDGLKAGQVITTGTCCGLNKVGPVAHAVADHGSLGKVEVRFVA